MHVLHNETFEHLKQNQMKLTIIPVMIGTRNKVSRLLFIPNDAANTTPIPKLRIPLDVCTAYSRTTVKIYISDCKN